MRQQLRHRRVALALGCELGPIRRHLLVVGEQPALDAHGDGDGRDPLGGGEDQLQGVLGVVAGALGIERTAPQVHDLATSVIDGRGRSDFLTVEVRHERVADLLPTRGDRTPDVVRGHHQEIISLRVSMVLAEIGLVSRKS